MKRRPRALAAALALAVACTAGRAAAEREERPVPDYDGRGGEPTTVGDVLLWVPRILLSPLYLVSEYVIRRPLGFLISTAEREQVPDFLYSLFTFGPDHNAGFTPIAFIDFGFDPSVGIYVFWNDVFVKNHDLRLRASTWGEGWIAASLSNRYSFGPGAGSSIGSHVTVVRRPDYVFYGIGPETLQDDESRYGSTRIDIGGDFDFDLWRSSRVYGELGVRSVNFHSGDYRDDPTLEEQVEAGVFPEPPGYATGYTSIYNGLHIALDTRRPRPAQGSGVRIELNAIQGSDVRRSPEYGWIRYGANAGVFYDITGHQRVVSLSAGVSFADPLSDQPVPFTEQVQLGGTGPLRGFLPGRLVDRSAAAALLRYRWPIWAWLDGSIQAAVGNVFGPHLEGFELSLLRFSGAIGIESVGSPDSSLEFLFGFGSETFEQGGKVDSLRVLLGTNQGF